MKSTARWVSASALLLPLGFLVNACEPDCAATLRCEAATDTEDDRTTIPRECDPSSIDWKNDPDCGVFVSLAGNDATGAGTPDAPVATLKVAIDLAKSKPIYACADTDAKKAFEEALIIDHHVTLFGGLDCQTWRRDPTGKTHWTAPAGQIVTKLTPVASLRAEGFAIQAKDAPDLEAGKHAPGRSSIAIVAETGSLLELSRCVVSAGAGGEGAAGEIHAGTGEPGVDGKDGQPGCVGPDALLGGAGGPPECGVTDVAGGRGGTGENAGSGGNGAPGQPADPAGENGGAGQQIAAMCTIGGEGNGGGAGEPGAGASDEQQGSLTSSGFTGVAGENGGPGKPGQGGGGGGGARMCWVAGLAHAGPSGGGGGSGACGGRGGNGGHGGGASIAILSLNAELRLLDVSLLTGPGGKGGEGGEGQQGGNGGVGGMAGAGNAGSVACAGGPGGKGGPGGRGGGGRGGPSIGIAHTGPAPDLSKVSFNTDVAVDPAPGGNVGPDQGSPGATGEVAPTLQFE